MLSLFEPLLARSLDDAIAYLQSDSSQPPVSISVREFLAHVHVTAQCLPAGRYALNLCGSRYLFMVAFCAVIVKRQTNLLPPNRNIATQTVLGERYPDTYIIHDTGSYGEVNEHGLALDASLPAFDITSVVFAGTKATSSIPSVQLDHLCAITFTSGSTGDSQPNLKTWRTFRESSLINVGYMVPAVDSVMSVLATVPAQHMWGLETSVLNALFSPLAVSDTRMLYPKDIQQALEALPEPRMLVSTPVHLRALANSGLTFPKVERILCATAPLAADLAGQVESMFDGCLCEVFGCSEVGSMACRTTSEGESWQLFEGLRLDANAHGTLASAAHLPASVQMQDVMELQEGNRFVLCGRHADMVEIAGKRGSLQEINRVLLSVDGVDDGVVFLPKNDTRNIPRLAAFVVAVPGIDKKHVIRAFREKLDAAFVPRPMYFVESLPREESGKLTRGRVDQLLGELTKV